MLKLQNYTNVILFPFGVCMNVDGMRSFFLLELPNCSGIGLLFFEFVILMVILLTFAIHTVHLALEDF